MDAWIVSILRLLWTVLLNMHILWIIFDDKERGGGYLAESKGHRNIQGSQHKVYTERINPSYEYIHLWILWPKQKMKAKNCCMSKIIHILTADQSAMNNWRSRVPHSYSNSEIKDTDFQIAKSSRLYFSSNYKFNVFTSPSLGFIIH